METCIICDRPTRSYVDGKIGIRGRLASIPVCRECQEEESNEKEERAKVPPSSLS